MSESTQPQLAEKLIDLARLVETLKMPCSQDDPESPRAIRNSKCMGISYTLRALAAEVEAVQQGQPASAVAVQAGERVPCSRCASDVYCEMNGCQRSAAAQRVQASVAPSDYEVTNEISPWFRGPSVFATAPLPPPSAPQPVVQQSWRDRAKEHPTIALVWALRSAVRNDSGAGATRESFAKARAIEEALLAAIHELIDAPAEQRMPLSEEQIDAIWAATPSQGDPTGRNFARAFARAIEAAHGIQEAKNAVGPADVSQPTEAERNSGSICQPDGLMFDKASNPRVRYVRVAYQGHTCVVTPDEAEAIKTDLAADRYTFTDVHLSKEEFDALPESTGF